MEVAHYPVSFDVAAAPQFDRGHVFLRLGLLVLLGFVGISLGRIFVLLYWSLPLAAAFLIARDGPKAFLAEDAEDGWRLAGALRWVLAFIAYMAFLTDQIPRRDPGESIRFIVQPAGSPTIGSALLRLLYSIPLILGLAVLGLISGVFWLISVGWILVKETQPEAIYNFQRGFVRSTARLFAYQASLVESYPPLSFDTGREPEPVVPPLPDLESPGASALA